MDINRNHKFYTSIEYYKLDKMEKGLMIKLGIGLVLAVVWGLVFSGIMVLDMIETTILIFITGAYILAMLYTPKSGKEKWLSEPTSKTGKGY